MDRMKLLRQRLSEAERLLRALREEYNPDGLKGGIWDEVSNYFGRLGPTG